MPSTFAADYQQLATAEQEQFADAIQILLRDGIIWRDHPHDQRVYAFLAKRRGLISSYLRVGGWDLHHHPSLAIFQVVHRDHAHRRILTIEATIWLLLLRLIYTEKRLDRTPLLTTYPTISLFELRQRHHAVLPERPISTPQFTAAMITLIEIKTVRPADGALFSPSDDDQLLELLPPLEVIVPDHEIATLAEQLHTYAPTPELSAS